MAWDPRGIQLRNSDIQFTKDSEDVPEPSRGYPGDAGWDLVSTGDVTVPARSQADVPTGIRVALPQGFWAQIITRSSTFRKHQLHVIEAVIDNGYRGELFIQVVNPMPYDTMISKGTRLAQVILHRIYDMRWVEVEKLPNSERGNNGFGSTGK